MECKFAVICKFCQPAGSVCQGRVPWNKGKTKETDATMALISEKVKAARAGQGGSIVVNQVNVTGRGKQAVKLVARVKKEARPAGALRHCKKCDFTVDTGNESKNKCAIMVHYRKEHPKKAAGKKPDKKSVVKKAPKESGSDKEAAAAFIFLKHRANKGKLTEEQSTVYDGLEPEIIGLPVAKWPDGSKEAVIKLYNEVRKEEEKEN